MSCRKIIEVDLFIEIRRDDGDFDHFFLRLILVELNAKLDVDIAVLFSSGRLGDVVDCILNFDQSHILTDGEVEEDRVCAADGRL